MHVILYYNPSAGTGRAEREAEALTRRLREAGHEPTLVRAGESASKLNAEHALVVLGGDGTVHFMLDHAIDTRAALYHFPMGTENLFAREFGTDRRPETLIAALDRGVVREVDVARCNGRAFSIMCGVGPDAGVVRRLADNRRGPILHISYMPHILAELVQPALAPLTVHVDGQQVVRQEPGWLVIANSRQYALRQDPAINADITDGLLDVAFFPARTSLAVIAWMLLSRLRLQHRSSLHIHARGRDIRIECPTKTLPYQLDGESITEQVGVGEQGLTIGLDRRRLRVLSPASC